MWKFVDTGSYKMPGEDPVQREPVHSAGRPQRCRSISSGIPLSTPCEGSDVYRTLKLLESFTDIVQDSAENFTFIVDGE